MSEITEKFVTNSDPTRTISDAGDVLWSRTMTKAEYERHQSMKDSHLFGVVTIIHRESGPAIERANGTKEWIINGKHHREDGPAIEHANGAKEWFRHGVRHREDGPCMIDPEGRELLWAINGEPMTQNAHAKYQTNGGCLKQSRTLAPLDLAKIVRKLKAP